MVNLRDVIVPLSDRPSVDVLAAGSIVCAHIAVASTLHRGDLLAWVSSGQRLTVYTTAATMIAIIGSLAAIALSLYQASDGKRITTLRASKPDSLRRNWRSLLLVTGTTSLLCLIAIILDRDRDPSRARFIFEYAILLAAVRFARLIWLFDSVLAISDRDTNMSPRRASAPPVNEAWKPESKSKKVG